MGASLQDVWIGGAGLQIRDEASVSEAREQVRSEGAAGGLPQVVIESMAVVVSELGRNQLVHARRGQIAVRRIERAGVPGLEVVAADRGPGIADPARALAGGESSAGTLGIGLAGARRLADETDFDVRLEEGTCIWARKFAAPVPRGHEAAILGRPCAGEVVSGDDGVFLRVGGALLFGLCDGLGHGAPAREAAARACAALRDNARLAPDQILGPCADALVGTRGAVMAVARLDGAGALEHACLGNIHTHIYRQHGTQHLPCQPGVLGAQGRRRRSAGAARAAATPGDVVVMFTDGLSSRASLLDQPALRRQHPILIAAHLLRAFGRPHDDAMVLVVR